MTIKFPKENLEEAINIAIRILNNKNLENPLWHIHQKNGGIQFL